MRAPVTVLSHLHRNSHRRLLTGFVICETAHDGLLDSAFKSQKATKAASAGIRSASSKAAIEIKSPAARRQKETNEVQSVGDIPSSSMAAKQQSMASASAKRHRSDLGASASTRAATRPPGQHADVGVKAVPALTVSVQGKSKPPRTSAEGRECRIAHKKRKLAYLARVKRTLDAANRVTRQALPLIHPPFAQIPRTLDV
jgi:hypothetical protein